MENLNALIVAPSYLNMYKDISEELEKRGWNVNFIEDIHLRCDPFNKHIKWFKMPAALFLRRLNMYWETRLLSLDRDCIFDFAIVLDGLSVSEKFFSILRKKNPKIKIVNYLFDKIDGFYEVQRSFNSYDKVFSFDINDCKKYKLQFLPIYWVPYDGLVSTRYRMFGFGAYEHQRYIMYKQIKNILEDESYNDFIKLRYKAISFRFLYRLECFIKSIIGLKYLPLKELETDMFTTESISTDDFRKIVAESDIILDSCNPLQSGMTARFMWALGLNKKIITSNKWVLEYPFYNSDNILLYDDGLTKDSLLSFISKEVHQDKFISQLIDKYRIDNWLYTLLK